MQERGRELATEQRALVDAVKRLYVYDTAAGGRPDISCVARLYADNARFIDLHSCRKGVREIENAFNLLLRFFSRVDLTEQRAYAIELDRPQATVLVCESEQEFHKPGKKVPPATRLIL